MHYILLNCIENQPPLNPVRFELSIKKIDYHKLDNTHMQTRIWQAKALTQELKSSSKNLLDDTLTLKAQINLS